MNNSDAEIFTAKYRLKLYITVYLIQFLIVPPQMYLKKLHYNRDLLESKLLSHSSGVFAIFASSYDR